VGEVRLTSAPAPSSRSILDAVAVPTDNEEGGVYPEAHGGDGPRTLADLQTPMRMTRTGWLIAAMLIFAALSFFIVVVCLGVDNS
jgi:hypothetical protein